MAMPRRSGQYAAAQEDTVEVAGNAAEGWTEHISAEFEGALDALMRQMEESNSAMEDEVTESMSVQVDSLFQ